MYTYRKLSKLPNRLRVFIHSGTHTLVQYLLGTYLAFVFIYFKHESILGTGNKKIYHTA